MLQAFIMKRIASSIIKKIMEKRQIKKMRDYVEKENELDVQMKQVYKTLNKYVRSLESTEKDVAQLRVNSHPPVFMKNDYENIIKRLNKLEKEK